MRSRSSKRRSAADGVQRRKRIARGIINLLVALSSPPPERLGCKHEWLIALGPFAWMDGGQGGSPLVGRWALFAQARGATPCS